MSKFELGSMASRWGKVWAAKDALNEGDTSRQGLASAARALKRAQGMVVFATSAEALEIANTEASLEAKIKATEQRRLLFGELKGSALVAARHEQVELAVWHGESAGAPPDEPGVIELLDGEQLDEAAEHEGAEIWAHCVGYGILERLEYDIKGDKAGHAQIVDLMASYDFLLSRKRLMKEDGARIWDHIQISAMVDMDMARMALRERYLGPPANPLPGVMPDPKPMGLSHAQVWQKVDAAWAGVCVLERLASATGMSIPEVVANSKARLLEAVEEMKGKMAWSPRTMEAVRRQAAVTRPGLAHAEATRLITVVMTEWRDNPSPEERLLREIFGV